MRLSHPPSLAVATTTWSLGVTWGRALFCWMKTRLWPACLDGRNHVVDERAPVNSTVHFYVLSWLGLPWVGSRWIAGPAHARPNLAIEQTFCMRIVSWACYSNQDQDVLLDEALVQCGLERILFLSRKVVRLPVRLNIEPFFVNMYII